MKIDGRCHCGGISFEAEADPGAVTVCHCTDCRRLTGSAFRANVRVPVASFVLRGGPPKSYIKTAESGNKRRHAFCGDCGTPVYACAVENPDSYSLRHGTITQRDAHRAQPRLSGVSLPSIPATNACVCARTPPSSRTPRES